MDAQYEISKRFFDDYSSQDQYICLDEFNNIHLRNLLDEKLFNENVFFVAKEIINSITLEECNLWVENQHLKDSIIKYIEHYTPSNIY